MGKSEFIFKQKHAKTIKCKVVSMKELVENIHASNLNLPIKMNALVLGLKYLKEIPKNKMMKRIISGLWWAAQFANFKLAYDQKNKIGLVDGAGIIAQSVMRENGMGNLANIVGAVRAGILGISAYKNEQLKTSIVGIFQKD